MKLTLPTDSAERKEIPIRSGCIDYFPAAIAGVAKHSVAGNNKHNPGEPLHHARGKSMDHADCIDRHLTDLADMLARRAVWTQAQEDAILAEANALCWRALALSQELHEKFGAPLAPRARLPEAYQKLNAAIDEECAKCASVLNSPPPAGADGLARALHATAQAAASDPSLRDDSPPSWNLADRALYADGPTPPALPPYRLKPTPSKP